MLVQHVHTYIHTTSRTVRRKVYRCLLFTEFTAVHAQRSGASLSVHRCSQSSRHKNSSHNNIKKSAETTINTRDYVHKLLIPVCLVCTDYKQPRCMVLCIYISTQLTKKSMILHNTWYYLLVRCFQSAVGRSSSSNGGRSK